MIKSKQTTNPVVINDEPYLGCGDFPEGWRGFHLQAEGDTLEALINDASVLELDHDGEVRGQADVFAHDSEILVAAFRVILQRYNKARGTSYTLEDLREYLADAE